MDPIFPLVAALSAGSGLAIAWASVVLVRRTRAEWTCTVDGHTVRVVATQNKKVMFVDGVRVAEKTTFSGSGATLRWELPVDAGPPIVVSVTVAYPRHGAAPEGSIYADGRWVGGSKRSEPGGESPSLTPGSAPAPITDARWPAAEVLIRDLRAVPRTDATEAARRIEMALREGFTRLAQLQRAGAAHEALGGEDAALDVARARLDAHVTELLHALLEVHLLAMDGAVAPLDQVDELVARMAAEAEVDRTTSRAARDGAARAEKG